MDQPLSQSTFHRANGLVRSPPAGSRPILLVESDFTIGGRLCGAIQSSGLLCVVASDPNTFELWRRTLNPALFVFNIDLAWGSFEIERLLREEAVLVGLSDDPESRLSALRRGFADALPHYLPHEEIVAKLRRFVSPSTPPAIIDLRDEQGPLAVDLATRQLFWRGNEVIVSPFLFDVAAYMAARPRVLVSPAALLRDIWHESWADTTKVHKTVSRLRKSLPADSRAYIVTKPGGYKYLPE